MQLKSNKELPSIYNFQHLVCIKYLRFRISDSFIQTSSFYNELFCVCRAEETDIENILSRIWGHENDELRIC